MSSRGAPAAPHCGSERFHPSFVADEGLRWEQQSHSIFWMCDGSALGQKAGLLTRSLERHHPNTSRTGRPRLLAQRVLPSMITATCRGSFASVLSISDATASAWAACVAEAAAQRLP